MILSTMKETSTEMGFRGKKKRREGRSEETEKDLLDQSIMDIIHSPSTIPQMSTDRVPKVIGLHDGSKGVHPPFKTAVD